MSKRTLDVEAEDLETVKCILREKVPGHEVWAFGSRVRGTARKFSDLDLAIIASKRLPDDQLLELRQAFSDSNLPFKVDLVDWSSITEEFKTRIKESYCPVK
jgi:uncharacterized protein